jgi:hypothetical protein
MKLLPIIMSAALTVSMATSAHADDLYTPAYLKRSAQNVNLLIGVSTLLEIMSISGGMLSAVLTVQDLGLAPRAICPPMGKDGRPDNFVVSFNLYQTLRNSDISAFPATDQGGAMFVYTAMVKAYPCR